MSFAPHTLTDRFSCWVETSCALDTALRIVAGLEDISGGAPVEGEKGDECAPKKLDRYERHGDGRGRLSKVARFFSKVPVTTIALGGFLQMIVPLIAFFAF